LPKIVGWNGLSDPHHQLVGEEGLLPPEFVELRPVQRRRAGQAFVTGDDTGLLISLLPIEAKHCSAKARARNMCEHVKICIEIRHQQIVEAGRAGSIATANQAVSVADQHPAQAKASLGVEAEQPPELARSYHNIDCAGISCDR
jgi:hypothetical protein